MPISRFSVTDVSVWMEEEGYSRLEIINWLVLVFALQKLRHSFLEQKVKLMTKS